MGTNNANNMTSSEIMNKLLQLRSPNLEKHTACKVTISQPSLCTDNGKAALSNNHLCSLLEDRNSNTVKNKNILTQHPGSKGLHQNPHGNG